MFLFFSESKQRTIKVAPDESSCHVVNEAEIRRRHFLSDWKREVQNILNSNNNKLFIN